MTWKLILVTSVAWRPALLGKSKDWFAQFQDNVTECDIRWWCWQLGLPVGQHYKVCTVKSSSNDLSCCYDAKQQTHTYIRMQLYKGSYIHTHMYMYIYKYIYTHIHMRVCMYIIHIHMCVCMYIIRYMHTPYPGVCVERSKWLDGGGGGGGRLSYG